MKKFLVRYIDKKVPGNKEIFVNAEDQEKARIIARHSIGTIKHIIHVEPVKEKRNKYNNKKVEHDGIKFDSKMERDYYDHLIDLQNKGIISEFIMQKNYVIFDGYTKNDSKVRPIIYRADFEVHYPDGRIEVIDIKGQPTKDFNIKKKLFEYRYPFELILLTYSNIDGGWITHEDLKEARKKRKIEKGK
ncbi:DUF1064 domain-containing protein [Lysinibacillus fusiformis]|uniref:DUF1064 domain-containing protein n=1 Tax=Lysinibacillus fusiformis TaxID=28031 RepID=UPI001F4E00B8|nr:DUF1064 domain-containing protein [Lysinibacillus fusiformis]MCK1987139.1 DUF1064 domain-containing protein [Lysinibacillus fusiformis]